MGRPLPALEPGVLEGGEEVGPGDLVEGGRDPPVLALGGADGLHVESREALHGRRRIGDEGDGSDDEEGRNLRDPAPGIGHQRLARRRKWLNKLRVTGEVIMVKDAAARLGTIIIIDTDGHEEVQALLITLTVDLGALR